MFRGCATSGDPWDQIVQTGPHTAANANTPAITTVSGSERLISVQGQTTDNTGMGAASPYTASTNRTDSTGTDCGFKNWRIDNTASTQAAVATTTTAPAQGAYAFTGIVFKPPAAGADVPLQTSAATSAATLALSVQTQVPLQSAPSTSGATLALGAPTRVTLETATATSSATLALRAPALITPSTAASTSSATLALTAPAKVTLGVADALASATLSLTAPAVSGVTHRAFDGAPGLGSSTNVNNLTGAFTLAAVVRRQNAGLIVVSAHATSGFSLVVQFIVTASSTLGIQTTAGASTNSTTLTLAQADGWAIIAATKAAGTATPRLHLYKSGAWSHENGSGTIANASAHSGGYQFFATSVLADYAFDLAVAGEWDSALSDGQIETLDWASQNWADLAPLALWNFDQTVTTDTIPDLIGAVDLAGNAGVPIGNDGPAGWDYNVSAEAEPRDPQRERGFERHACAHGAGAGHPRNVKRSRSSCTLTLTAPARPPLATAAATSSATLALTAPTRVPLQTAGAASSATLVLTATARVPLGTAAATTAATLALRAQTTVPLGTSAATSTATLALTAKTTVTLQTAGATSSATLSVTAGPGVIACQASAATSNATLSLTAPTRVPLGTAASVSSASLALTTPAALALGTANASSAATLALRALTQLPLAAVTVTSSGTLALSARTTVPLGASVAQSAATLGVYLTPSARSRSTPPSPSRPPASSSSA